MFWPIEVRNLPKKTPGNSCKEVGALRRYVAKQAACQRESLCAYVQAQNLATRSHIADPWSTEALQTI